MHWALRPKLLVVSALNLNKKHKQEKLETIEKEGMV